ncbi:MAG: hypothetical protein Q9165_001446 [Trypethelium subeluteriae]
MDVFIRGLAAQSTLKDIEHSLRDPLQMLGIKAYHCMKMGRKGCAIVTFLHRHEATLFLQQHGTPQQSRQSRPRVQLKVQGRDIHCHEGHHPSDEFILRSLRSTESQNTITDSKTTASSTMKSYSADQTRSSRTFAMNSVACGALEFVGQDPVFVSHFHDNRAGNITFGNKALAVNFTSFTPAQAERFLIPYYSIETIGTGTYSSPAITLSLRWAPRFYNQASTSLMEAFSQLGLTLQSNQGNPPTQRSRVTSMGLSHVRVVDICFVYRIQLADRFDVPKVRQMLQRDQSPPSHLPWVPMTLAPPVSLETQLKYLSDQLAVGQQYISLDFRIKFQAQRLAQNGYLPPLQVIELLPKIVSIAHAQGNEKTAEALRILARELPFIGPHTSPDDLSISTLEGKIVDYAENYTGVDSIYAVSKRHAHIVLIYRAQVTPTGVYLQGPDQDTTNRVLRKYPAYLDHFMRVEFMDEDGEKIRFERRVSYDHIFHGRFKGILADGISVAGRKYHFLGFSHSSLRQQSAWFIHPFFDKAINNVAVPSVIIRGLGEFSHIRSPAKCAARIGQAFTDTTSSIHIGQDGYKVIADIERVELVDQHGLLEPLVRNFSDGVGTISWDLLRRIWREHKISRTLRPTLIQIRFGGAKGMISLDTRLQGEVLNLRKSMIKFESKDDWDLEICGEATRPLPMFLNRPLIKILEDLGVEAQTFLGLQTERINELRTLMTHPINAEKFLEENHIGRSSQIPSLIRMLNEIDLIYQADEFLTQFVEMAIIHQLREMKYRGRIRLDKTQGVTLYGIMDETGYLNEGEIYVPIERKGEGRSVLTDGKVAITRSPAMHPGDVQLVHATDVPEDSPLNALKNCVVFSSRGRRDLPSQLSGGDLDGDQYHIIFAQGLLPTQTYPAANYPRVAAASIDRPVEIQDMTNFFVEFMENDRLGQISNMHMQLADQKELGVLHPDCVTLAELASTAVDFSKTGIRITKTSKANMTRLPKYSRSRPDFMAPGPRVKMQGRLEFDKEDEEMEKDDLLSQDDAGFLYYPSHKALGRLYRAIDEHKFLQEVRGDAQHITTLLPNEPLVKSLWEYIKRNTMVLQWEHLRDLANEIRESYEDNLIDMTYKYSTVPHHPLTEIEVITGIIFGRNESGYSKRLRENNMEMKEQYDRDVQFTISRILHNGRATQVVSEDALALATACFTVTMEKPRRRARRFGELKSFRYIAAALCLREIKKFQPDRFLTDMNGSMFSSGYIAT